MALNKGQEAAAIAFKGFIADPNQNELILTGGPGYGKSFLVKQLLEDLPADLQVFNLLELETISSVHVTATTNKAAAIISNFTNVEGGTVHKLFGFRVWTNYSTGKIVVSANANSLKICNSLIVIDEAGFVGRKLLELILSHVENCKILWVCDKWQLGPVGEGVSEVFNRGIPTVTLTEPIRFTGAIGELCTQTERIVRTGQFETLEIDGINIQQLDTVEMIAKLKEYYPLGAPKDSAKVMTYTNGSVIEYNSLIREFQGITQQAWQMGEEVLINNRYVGTIKLKPDTIGTISGISPVYTKHNIDYRTIRLDKIGYIDVPVDAVAFNAVMKKAAKIKDWKTFYILSENFADLRSTHACTVHKSQGSTYETVFIDLEGIGECPDPEVASRLIHTACSRASKRIFMYGDLPKHYGGAVCLK